MVVQKRLEPSRDAHNTPAVWVPSDKDAYEQDYRACTITFIEYSLQIFNSKLKTITVKRQCLASALSPVSQQIWTPPNLDPPVQIR